MTKIKSKIRTIGTFEPEKSLLELRIFKILILIHLIIFLVSFLLILCFSDLVFDFSYHGFNEFITIFKFPLGSLALFIPTAALLASNHRSVQTKTQIELTNSQNNFINYYKHLEEFEKHMNTIKNLVFSPKNIHTNLFNEARIGIYSVNNEKMKIIEGKLINFIELLVNYSEYKDRETISNIYSSLLKELNINPEKEPNSIKKMEKESLSKLREIKKRSTSDYYNIDSHYVYIHSAFLQTRKFVFLLNYSASFDAFYSKMNIFNCFLNFNPKELSFQNKDSILQEIKSVTDKYT